MLNLSILSIILFAVVIIILFFIYLYDKNEIYDITRKTNIENENTKNLEYICYNELKHY